uniref:D-alanyl-D-alanine carboxypeptidase family protein n=1 Tax=Ndongobacter massiliensis TaxID=1871025 RepID=UPI000931AB8D|nr:D-alanyl-D-alanine carboxypeptidase family protein [Ndongobacter massiliensis]
MRIRKKGIFVLLLLFSLLLPFFATPVFAEPEMNESVASNATDPAQEAAEHFSYNDEVSVMLIGDPESEKILFEKNIDETKPVASMSKLMTYYIVKKQIASGAINLSDVVTVSASAAALHRFEYSNYGLIEGEKLTVEQLLRGLMVVSGNDAAEALAECVSGNKETFAALMNQTAQELGLTRSHFINPHGLTEGSDMNAMSARDLFSLCARILKEFPEVTEYAKILAISEPERNFSGKATIASLLESIPGLDGLKTGMTDEAGYCFAGSADLSVYNKNLNFHIVAIEMGAPTEEARWRTVKELVDFSAGSFHEEKVVQQDLLYKTAYLPQAENSDVKLYPAESYSTITYQTVLFDVQYELYDNVPLPAPAGTAFGEIRISRDGQAIKKINLVAHEDVEKASFSTNLSRGLHRFVDFLGALTR